MFVAPVGQMSSTTLFKRLEQKLDDVSYFVAEGIQMFEEIERKTGTSVRFWLFRFWL